MNDTTLAPAQCAKCLKAITYEPRVYIVDGMHGYILCAECFNKMFGAIPENMNIEVDVIVHMQPKTEWSARAKVKSVERATPNIVEPDTEEAKE